MKNSVSWNTHRWLAALARSILVLSILTMSLSIIGCASGSVGANGENCECGVFEEGSLAGECYPCIDGGGLKIPAGVDAGTPFLNSENIDRLNELFLDQDGDGVFTIFTNESGIANEVGVRVQNALYGTPAQNIPVNFQIRETNTNRPSGSQLNARMVQSNQFGIAKVTITGGPLPAFFELNISSPQTKNSLTYKVNLVQRMDLTAPPADPAKPKPMNIMCLKTKGTYDVINRYQPASILGDDFNRTLMTIAQVITDPGSLVADLIADNLGGIAGRLVGGAIRGIVNNLVAQQIRRLPNWAQNAINITGDLATNLTDLEIRATMELGEINPMTCELRGLHRWNELTFIWNAGCPPNAMNCGRYDVPLRELGVSLSESEFSASVELGNGLTDKLYIQEHSLQMNIAVAVLWFIEQFVLPQYFNGVQSFGDLFARVVPCDAIGDVAANAAGDIFGLAIDDIVEDACRAAVRSAGDRLVNDLIQDLNVDTFGMSGECDIRDNDGDQFYDRLQNGVWSGELEGTFTGERTMGQMQNP